MFTGLFFVLLGVLVLLVPQLLQAMVAGMLIMFGIGIMATGWQLRRMRRRADSWFASWITRF
jgi:uncharacterized membrane protein YqjE